MIKVHRLSGEEYVLNADLIETIEVTPDVVITLSTGRKFMVADSLETIIDEVIAYQRACRAVPLAAAAAALESPLERGCDQSG